MLPQSTGGSTAQQEHSTAAAGLALPGRRFPHPTTAASSASKHAHRMRPQHSLKPGPSQPATEAWPTCAVAGSLHSWNYGGSTSHPTSRGMSQPPAHHCSEQSYLSAINLPAPRHRTPSQHAAHRLKRGKSTHLPPAAYFANQNRQLMHPRCAVCYTPVPRPT